MFLIPIPAVADKYLWLLHDGKRAALVDPGDAEPVLRPLEKHALQLESILDSRPTRPGSIAQELLINPFLRTPRATIMAAAHRSDTSVHDGITAFAAIRQWKNQFK